VATLARGSEETPTVASNNRIPDEDAALFRSVMSGVRRLHDDRVEPALSRPPARRRARALEEAVSDALMPDGVDETAPRFGERQQFARPGVQSRILRRLAGGRMRVDETLDLHGMRVQEAREALARFLAESMTLGRRCVRVVTGKGFGSRGTTPVLKAQVDRWLRLDPRVLAFCSAPERDGGTGAVTILLRRPGAPP
jgi:DNA-nicking Smr family endonuclease